MTALDQDDSLVETISNLVLRNDAAMPISHSNDFPLRVRVDLASSLAKESLQQLKSSLSSEGFDWTGDQNRLEFTTSEKSSADRILSHLLENNWKISLDYSQFVSHPGMIFVRGFQRSPTLIEDITEHFSKQTRYNLLSDVTMVSLPEDSNGTSEVAVVIKYDNHLDANHALGHARGTSVFGPKMVVNRYISKKERAILLNDQNAKSHSLATSNEYAMVYDTILVENFNDFVGGSFSLDQFQTFLDKFELFLSIESIFFPTANSESDRLRFKKIGYIRIVQDKDMNLKLLKALYYFNGLTLKQFLEFSEEDIYDLSRDLNVPESHSSLKDAILRLSIAQRKHNHFLYENSDSKYVGFGTDRRIQVCESNKSLDSSFIDLFSKTSNYQETNVYVNNFPIIFENNDDLWSEFWNQFGVGRVKSAKIIKPYFYSKKSEGSLGKIGFVFYEDFKMALRAIILTNNKVIKYKNCPSILIQTSFALQKHRSYSQPSSKLPYPPLHHTTPPLNYYQILEIPRHFNDGPPYITEQFAYHLYMMSMPPYSPGALPDERPDNENEISFPRLQEEAGAQVGTSYPPQYGYYYPFYPYSPQMHLAAMPPPMAANGPPPMHIPPHNDQRTQRKKSW